MSKWKRAFKRNKDTSRIKTPPNEEGVYWISDGWLIEVGYWHRQLGWGIISGPRFVPVSDWNFDVKYYQEMLAPKLTQRIIKETIREG